MSTTNIPEWAGSSDTMARRVNPIIHLIGQGKAVTPTEISSIVRPAGSTKDYSAKYITFLRLLGFDFTVQKDGRKIVSYTCIVEPSNAADIRAISPKSKSAKTKTVKAAPTKPVKSVEKVKSSNLAKIKSVGEKLISTNEPGISTYTVDEDWDSVDNVDLKKLVG